MHLLATLLNTLTCYYPLDQFFATPAAEPAPNAEPADAVAVEPWLSSRFEELAPFVPAPNWHLPTDAEVLLLPFVARLMPAFFGCLPVLKLLSKKDRHFFSAF